ELCPVGALTSQDYRFRARPWDVENAGSVCTLCPAQCNVTLTVRDERVLRVLAREHPEVDDGWLCDAGRFAYPAHPSAAEVNGGQALGLGARVAAPLVRDGGTLRPVSWERALHEAAAGLARAGARSGAIAGGAATNEEGYLLARLMRDALGSPHLDSRAAGALPLELMRALCDPCLQARGSDLEFAHSGLLLAGERAGRVRDCRCPGARRAERPVSAALRPARPERSARPGRGRSERGAGGLAGAGERGLGSRAREREHDRGACLSPDGGRAR